MLLTKSEGTTTERLDPSTAQILDKSRCYQHISLKAQRLKDLLPRFLPSTLVKRAVELFTLLVRCGGAGVDARMVLQKRDYFSQFYV